MVRAAAWAVLAVLVLAMPVAAGPTLTAAVPVPEGPESQGAKALSGTSTAEDGDCREHLPIRIEQDEGPLGFVLGDHPATGYPIHRPGSGVVAGNGTADDPYVIAGWCIMASRTSRDAAPPPAGDGAGIRIAHTDAHVIVRDNIVNGTHDGVKRSLGIQTEDAANVSIRENLLRGHDDREGTGIQITASTAVDVTGNDITREYRGLVIDTTKRVVVRQNRIQRAPEGTGIRVSSTENVTIRDNLLRGHNDLEGTGIRMAASSDVRIAENEIADGYRGVSIEAATNATVDRNQIRGDLAGLGIGTARGDDVAIVNNDVHGHHPGIQVYRHETGATVTNNTMTGPGTGIMLDRSRGTLVSGNEVERGAYRGILHWQSSDTSLRNNTVVGSDRAGIRLFDSQRVVVAGNVFEGSEENGIRLGESSRIRLTGNRVTNNSGAGIHFRDTNRSLISNNTLRDNGEAGLDLTSSAGSFVIWVANTTNVTATHNEIAGNRVGVSVTRGFDNAVTDNNIRGNLEGGLVAVGVEETLDATWNWWGCPDGPDDPACDNVEGEVDYEPWRDAPNPDAGTG